MTFPTAYLPPVSYLRALNRADEAWIETEEHYVKQTLRNRCRIDSPGGVLSLSIPIVKPIGKTAIKDIRISNHGHWRHQHWTALVSSYGQSPFFEYYQDDFAPFYEQEWTFLADFNEALLRLLCKLIDISPQWQRTTAYQGISDWEHSVNEPLKPYYQGFALRHGFLTDLSTADLLFNMGPESVFYL